jgi:guanylate kinase
MAESAAVAILGSMLTVPSRSMIHPPKEARGLLLLVSGPPGTGKTALCRRLEAAHQDVERVITCTTRAPRPGEQHGVDYCFLSDIQFDEAVANDEFIEWSKAHVQRFGTSRNAICPKLDCQVDVVINVDMQGARFYRQAFAGDAAMRSRLVRVFITPPDERTIEEHLLANGDDAAELTEHRMKTALHEMAQWTQQDYCIVTGTPDEDFARIEAIWRAEKCRVARLCQAATMMDVWMRAESQIPFDLGQTRPNRTADPAWRS